MGMRGRLTKEQFAFTMPVDAPLYQRPPFYYKDVQLALFEYETEAAAAASILPAPLELSDTPTAALALVEYPWTTFGPYNEAILFVMCTHRGRPLQYITQIFLTTEPPMAAGREIWGIPKKLAHIGFVKENDHLMGYVERPKGLRICSGVMRPERPITLASFSAIPPVCLRVIPSPEEGAPPSLAELIEIDVVQRPKDLWEGPGSCHFTGASDLDPWHKLPVKKMRRCTFAVYDMDLKFGKIIERL